MHLSIVVLGFGAFPEPVVEKPVSPSRLVSGMSQKDVANIGKELFSSIHSTTEEKPRSPKSPVRKARNFDLPDAASYTGPVVPLYTNRGPAAAHATVEAGREWEQLFERSFIGFAGGNKPAPAPAADVYSTQSIPSLYPPPSHTFGMDPFASVARAPAPIAAPVPRVPTSSFGGYDDFDPYNIPAAAPVAKKESSVRERAAPAAGPAKTSKERMEEQVMLLYVSGEINASERDYLLSLVASGSKALRDALKALDAGDVGPFIELLKMRHDEAQMNDEAIARSLAEGSHSPKNRAKKAVVVDDGIPSYDPKTNQNPPGLLRLRGEDLCGDVMMRVRSKMISKKWKRLFFQIHGDAIANFETTHDWLHNRPPYMQKRITAFMQVSKVNQKSYNDMPIFTCKLMENDRDFIDNGYNASFGFDVSLPVKVVAKFGSHSRRTIEALSKELNGVIQEKIGALQKQAHAPRR